MKKLLAGAFAAMLTGHAAVQAAIPTEITAMFDTLETDAASVVTTYVIPAVAALTGLWVILKIGKKGASKIG